MPRATCHVSADPRVLPPRAPQVTDSDHLSHGLGGVSHASHVAGFLAGGLLALAALPDFKARRAARVRGGEGRNDKGFFRYRCGIAVPLLDS